MPRRSAVITTGGYCKGLFSGCPNATGAAVPNVQANAIASGDALSAIDCLIDSKNPIFKSFGASVQKRETLRPASLKVKCTPSHKLVATQKSLSPSVPTPHPKPTEAGAEPLQALESSVRDDRWMSRPRALNLQTKQSTPSKPPTQEPSPFTLPNPQS